MQLDKRQKFRLIKEAVRHAVQRTGDMSFKESQRVVPVDTGFLKNSGKMVGDVDSITVTYSAEYASIVERGWAGGLVWTKPHTRRNGVYVKGHYKDQPPRRESLFIRKSFERYFKENYISHRTYFQNAFMGALRERLANSGVTIQDYKGRSV
jgi:hypothetical protein